MEVFGAVVEVAVLAMFHLRQDFAPRGAVAFQLVRDEDPGHGGQTLEELAEKLLRRLLVPAALDENIQDVAVLINGAPEIVTLLVDRDEYLVQVPLVARPGTPTPELIRVLLAELATPCAHGFVRHDHPPDEQELFHVAMAETEAEIQP